MQNKYLLLALRAMGIVLLILAIITLAELWMILSEYNKYLEK
jgi:hypothetical protein